MFGTGSCFGKNNHFNVLMLQQLDYVPDISSGHAVAADIGSWTHRGVAGYLEKVVCLWKLYQDTGVEDDVLDLHNVWFFPAGSGCIPAPLPLRGVNRW